MRYEPNPNRGPVRDEANVSQIANERPALAPRIQSQDECDPECSLRGSDSEDRVARFNRQLRGE